MSDVQKAFIIIIVLAAHSNYDILYAFVK